MSQDFLSQIRAQAQQRIARRMYGQADESERLLQQLGTDIATACGCTAVFGAQKNLGRAQQKVMGEKGGDWYELYDVVRMTILAPNISTLRQVQTMIRTQCTARNGLGIIRDFEQVASQSACGYSGLNFVVRLQNGEAGEIQANLPNVLYGQFKESLFQQVFGVSLFMRIKSSYQVEGGVGHPFYEIYRTGRGTMQGKQAADLSTRYFNYLRGMPNLNVGKALQQEIDTFKQSNRSAFRG